MPSFEPTDDELMRAYALGSASAFDTLYQRHRQPLYRFVRRLLGPRQLNQAEEVFQDTWLRVISARQRWAPQGASFRTWLFTLAHHRAVDCLRKSGREFSLNTTDDDAAEPWQPLGTPWQQWPHAATRLGSDSAAWVTDAAAPSSPMHIAAPEVPGPAERAFWRAAGQRLLDCLNELPETQRAVFLLHHEDGFSLSELATSLQLGFETAKSRLRYAMAKLRTCMGAYLPTPDGAAPP